MLIRVPTVSGVWHAVRCDHCPDESDAQPSEVDARQQADIEGYRMTGPRDLCSECWSWCGGQECA